MSLEDTLRTIVREEIRTALSERHESGWLGCITLAEAAKLASVSITTLEKWGRQGLRILRKGHVRRVDVAELRAFMQELETSKAAEPEDRAREILATITPFRKVR